MEAKKRDYKKRDCGPFGTAPGHSAGFAKITLVGNLQLYVENHKGIIEYSTGLIRINTKSGILVVTGSDLSIRTIVIEEIIVVGRIDKVEFLQ